MDAGEGGDDEEEEEDDSAAQDAKEMLETLKTDREENNGERDRGKVKGGG